MPSREDKQELDALLRKGEHEVNAPLQGSPNEGKRGGGWEALRRNEHKVLLRRDPIAVS